MLFGYSLAIDEYIEASCLQPADCNLLEVCCPVCMKPVVLLDGNGRNSLAHLQPSLEDPVFHCDERLADLTLEYREQQNMQAQRRRAKIVQGDLLIDLLAPCSLRAVPIHFQEARC